MYIVLLKIIYYVLMIKKKNVKTRLYRQLPHGGRMDDDVRVSVKHAILTCIKYPRMLSNSRRLHGNTYNCNNISNQRQRMVFLFLKVLDTGNVCNLVFLPRSLYKYIGTWCTICFVKQYSNLLYYAFLHLIFGIKDS